MKLRTYRFLAMLASAAVLFGGSILSRAQGFTYQGQLVDNGHPANGSYSMLFRLYPGETNGTPVGNPITLQSVAVTNGLFNVVLDFGSANYTGDRLWLEIAVADPATDTTFTVLSPRQEIGTNPYAVRAAIADSSARAGTVDSVPWSAVKDVPSGITAVNQRFSDIFGSGSSELYTFVKSIGTDTSLLWIRQTSTFSGWAQPIGAVQGFSAVRFYVRPWDAAHLITKVRCRIREIDYTGPILADATVNIVTTLNQDALVTVNFGQTISNDAGKSLWLEYFTDGYTGQTQVPNFVPPPPSERYAIGGSVTDTSLFEAATSYNFYVGFYQSSSIFDDSVVSDDFKSKLEAIPTKDTVHIDLPPTLYAVEGTELSIYFANVLRANVPLSTLDIRVTCSKGALYQPFWRVTPEADDSGTFPLTLSVYFANHLITSKESRLIIAPANAGTGLTRQILMIGDSITANGIMATELQHMFETNTMKLVFKGAKGIPPVVFEATKGWGVDQFYTDASSSPFFFDGKFDFAQYLTKNSISLAAGDWVTINLGINDVFSINNDQALTDKINEMITAYNAMIANIVQAVPGVRIGVCLTIPPPSGQDSFGLVYGTGQTWARYEYNNKTLVAALINAFGASEASGIYLIPINVNIDTVYNYTTQSIPVNARNPSITFTTAPNGVHPANSGYYQIADSFKAFLKAKL